MGADGFIVDQIPSGTTSESIEALLEVPQVNLCVCFMLTVICPQLDLQLPEK